MSLMIYRYVVYLSIYYPYSVSLEKELGRPNMQSKDAIYVGASYSDFSEICSSCSECIDVCSSYS